MMSLHHLPIVLTLQKRKRKVQTLRCKCLLSLYSFSFGVLNDTGDFEDEDMTFKNRSGGSTIGTLNA